MSRKSTEKDLHPIEETANRLAEENAKLRSMLNVAISLLKRVDDAENRASSAMDGVSKFIRDLDGSRLWP